MQTGYSVHQVAHSKFAVNQDLLLLMYKEL